MKSQREVIKVDPVDREIYRRLVRASDLVAQRVTVKETDLLVLADREISETVRATVLTQRDRLERYIADNAGFRESLVPLEVRVGAPQIVRAMAVAAAAAGVGPMAAVAGALCHVVGERVRGDVRELILENGGDLYMAVARERTVGIYAGAGEPFLGLRIRPEHCPLGVCTSSGRIGHSLSLGESAAATVVARCCALADAAATAVGNQVRGARGVRQGLLAAQRIPGVLGAVIVSNGEIGAWGEVELVEL